MQQPTRFVSSSKFQLTDIGRSFIGFGVLLVFPILSNGHNLLYVLMSVLLALLVLGAIWPWWAIRRLAVTFEVPVEWYAKTDLPVIVRLSSVAFPVQVSWCGETWTQPRSGVCVVARRGRMEVPQAEVSCSAPFGCVKVSRTVTPVVQTLHGSFLQEWVVFPRIHPMTPEAVDRVLKRFAGSSTSPHEPQTDIASVRAYRAGDDLRTIHWKASAKRQSLVVKEFEAVQLHAVVIQMPEPASLGEEEREAVIEEVASALVILIQWDRLVQLRIGSWATPFGAGRAHLLDMLQALALA